MFRLRNWFLWVVPLALIAALFYTDPDKGAAGTLIWALRLCVGFFVVIALAHLGRRIMFDYPESDAQSTFRKAREHPIGAGLLAVALSIITAALLMVVSTAVRAQDVRSYVPPRCMANLVYLRSARDTQWPSHPDAGSLAALAEHESCVTLTSSRCCSPTAQLKTQREEGAGILQITRAFRSDGSTRFDALQELSDEHPVLRELSWENVYKRPDLQNLALVLKARGDFLYFTRLGVSAGVALDFADAAYNGGRGGVQSDRRACAISTGCDPGIWFANVELHCTKSRAALYGSRSACDINRFHVRDVRETRTPKYRALML